MSGFKVAGGVYGYYLVLVVAVVNVSMASILVRMALGEGVHGFAAATWRCVFSSLLTWALFFGLHGFKPSFSFKFRDVVLMASSGVALGLHFALWMHSLAHINVAASVTIVDSYPAILAIAGRLLLESYSAPQYLGALTAMIGVAGLSTASYTGQLAPSGGDPVYGSLLAFGGAVAVAVYFTIGKAMRRKYSTVEYTAIVYSAAALTTIVLSMAWGVKLSGYEVKAWALLVLLALIPMLGGHTLVNYVLGKLSLLASTVPILGEPVGASILAFLILGEPITLPIAAFMAITLSGIALTLLWERPTTIKA
ncbi:MAG: DMT family transporter [Thermoprotei archaeon]|nr:DMT family transporter [Thermoprotei archaeon]